MTDNKIYQFVRTLGCKWTRELLPLRKRAPQMQDHLAPILPLSAYGMLFVGKRFLGISIVEASSKEYTYIEIER